MTSDSVEVKSLLDTFIRKMNTTSDSYTGQHIAMCYYGLQNMRNTHVVSRLLDNLNNRLISSTHTFDCNNIVNAIYGLKVL